jgi:hypothetical protein
MVISILEGIFMKVKVKSLNGLTDLLDSGNS